MPSLEKSLRSKLENTVKAARDVAESGARSALEQIGVGDANPPEHLTEKDRDLRRRLRIHGRQLGDELFDEPTALAAGVRKGTQSIERLVEEVAYEHWHRLLFASYLAENQLLMYDESFQDSFQFSVFSVQQEDDSLKCSVFSFQQDTEN